MRPSVLPGAEPWSSRADGPVGVLALHGFTGNPSSMRPLARALADAGVSVELPRLPGHGTVIEDMVPTRWSDWTGAVEAARDRLATDVDRIVVTGLSMGGSLTLWAGRRWSDLAGLVCVNPATRPQGDDVIEMLDEMLADGVEVLPAIGSDIADPDVAELSYDGAPVAPLLSFQRDGLATMVDRYHELTVPLRLFTSRQDHVVDPGDSEHLAATYGGPVQHTWLERSYHVATQDFDRDLVAAETVAFVRRVTDGAGVPE